MPPLTVSKSLQKYFAFYTLVVAVMPAWVTVPGAIPTVVLLSLAEQGQLCPGLLLTLDADHRSALASHLYQNIRSVLLN